MKQTKVIFPINDIEYFAILIPHTRITELRMCEQLHGVYYTKHGQSISIMDHYNCIESELDGLIYYLTQALQGELEITSELTNIGYEWNKRLFSRRKHGEWLGRKYLCFSTADGPETFLYNENGTIVLEIIPTYPWLFGARPHGLKKIPFQQFLKEYKPLVKTIIPRERAEEWLQIAQNLRTIIDKNEMAQ